MFTFNPFLGLSGFQIIPNVQIEENQMNQMLIQQQERLYFYEILTWKEILRSEWNPEPVLPVIYLLVRASCAYSQE